MWVVHAPIPMKLLYNLFARILSGESASIILDGLSCQKRGHVGEALLRILTLLGIHPTDPSKTVIPYRIVVKGRRLEALSTLTERVNQLRYGFINEGNKTGKMDVCWRDEEKIAVCSSKIGMKEVKAIKDLEIVPMLSEFTESGGYTEKGVRISRESVVAYSLVSCREEVLRIAQRAGASSQAECDNLLPLDVENLNRMCANLRERLVGCPNPEDVNETMAHLMGCTKPALRLRFHQRLIEIKLRRLMGHGIKTVLLGALPRSGKTFIGAEVARVHKRILVITTCPTETGEQWKSIFRTYREFSGYRVVDLNANTSEEVAEECRTGSALVAVSSLQFFKMKERPELERLEWDIVLMDEVHAGGSTDRSDEVQTRYVGWENTVKVMMTATYTKPAEYYDIPLEHCCFWDMEDARLMRRWGDADVILRLGEKYGASDVEQARAAMYCLGETDKTLRACYEDAPRLGIITTVMQQDVYAELRTLLGENDSSVYGFSMRSIFMPTRNGQAFQNPRAVDRFLALVTGSEKIRDYKRGDMSIFARIRRYWRSVGHRESDGGEFMTQMWFLPSGTGQLLDHVKSCLIAHFARHAILKGYVVYRLDAGTEDIAKKVEAEVQKAKEDGAHGVILLTGNVASMGISLPDVDVAFLLHDIESADMTYQQMMRVLTNAVGKKCGLVVDFNVWRVLTTLHTYATSRCGKEDTSCAERIHWCISHLVDIDPDLWECAESTVQFPRERIAEELTVQWRSMLEKSGGTLQRLTRTRVDLGDDQMVLDRIARYRMEKEKGMRMQLASEQEPLSAGIERKSEEREKDEEDKEKDEDEEDEKKEIPIQHANLNELLARLIPEIAVLSGGTYDLLEAVRAIHGNPAQREAMNQFLMKLYQ